MKLTNRMKKDAELLFFNVALLLSLAMIVAVMLGGPI